MAYFIVKYSNRFLTNLLRMMRITFKTTVVMLKHIYHGSTYNILLKLKECPRLSPELASS